MAANSNIEWCDITWVLVAGCDKKDQGCQACYAIKTAHIRGANPKMVHIYGGLTERRADGSLNWTGLVRPIEERMYQPIDDWSPKPGSKREPKGQRIFLTSMGDLWHKNVPTEFIARAYAVMAHTPWHSYRVLTKRWERMQRCLSDEAFVALVRDYYDEISAERGYCRSADDDFEWPLPNVITMASASLQHELEDALPHLLKTPAVLRGLSLEPLLGPIDLARLMPYFTAHYTDTLGQPTQTPPDDRAAAVVAELARAVIQKFGYGQLHWVITGGESGGKPARRLVEKCDHFLPDRGYWTLADSCPYCASVPDPGHQPPYGLAGTGWKPKAEALEWVRSLRDQCQLLGVDFMLKQWGGVVHNSGGRLVDGKFYDGDPGVPVFLNGRWWPNAAAARAASELVPF